MKFLVLPILAVGWVSGGSTFSTVLDSPGPDRATEIVTSGEGYLAFGMWAERLSVPTDLLLMELDGMGDILAFHRFGGPQSEIPGGMAAGEGDILFLSATVIGSSPDSGLAVVLAVDELRDTLWIAELQMGCLCSPCGVAALADGGCVVAGTVFSGTGSEGFAARFDSFGAQVWSKLFSTGEPCSLTDVESSDLGVTCCGTSGETGSREFWLLSLDMDGNESLSTTFGSGPHTRAASVLPIKDGFVLTGAFEGATAGVGDVYVARLDTLGGIVWDMTFGGDSWDRGEDVCQSTDGGFLVTGWSRSFAGGGEDRSDIFLLKLDSAGGISWYRIHETAKSDYAWGVTSCADGGFAVAGCTADYHGSLFYDAWILRVDSMGGFSPQGLVPRPRSGLTAVPAVNPCMENIGIRLESECSCEVSILLFDIHGRLVAEPVRNEVFDPGERTISFPAEDSGGSHLPPGVYLVSVRSGETHINSNVTVLPRFGGH